MVIFDIGVIPGVVMKEVANPKPKISLVTSHCWITDDTPEADNVLSKVSDFGVESLTDDEKIYLITLMDTALSEVNRDPNYS